ncbi:hypothetical protein FOA52_006354 [Chlamydomonas sp. UWO 241]|nr:hypothetical protein FOA52_006354 [Chlamydomonas sp. UWO 241]
MAERAMQPERMGPHGVGGEEDASGEEPVSAPASPAPRKAASMLALLAGGEGGDEAELPRSTHAQTRARTRATPAARPHGVGTSSAAGPSGDRRAPNLSAPPPAGPSGDRRTPKPSATAARARAAAPSTQQQQQPEQQPGGQVALNPARDEVLTNPDLLQCVYRFLDVRSRCRACCTARLWQAAASSRELWYEVVLLMQPMTEWQLKQLCRRHGVSMHRLVLGANAFPAAAASSLLTSCVPHLRGLSSLTLHAMPLYDSALQQIDLGLPQLTTLMLTACSLLRTGNSTAALQHPRLQRLSLLGCRCSRLALGCPSLVHLSLRHSQLTMLTHTGQMPLLVSADLGGVAKLNDAGLRAGLTPLTSLSALCLERCSGVSVASVGALLGELTGLRSLDLTGCAALTLKVFARLASVRTLLLNGCASLSSSATAQQAVEYCPYLEELYMDGCPNLTSLAVSNCSRLRILSLRACRSLVTLDISASRLEQLLLTELPAVRYSSEDLVVRDALAAAGAPSADAEAAAAAPHASVRALPPPPAPGGAANDGAAAAAAAALAAHHHHGAPPPPHHHFHGLHHAPLLGPHVHHHGGHPHPHGHPGHQAGHHGFGGHGGWFGGGGGGGWFGAHGGEPHGGGGGGGGGLGYAAADLLALLAPHAQVQQQQQQQIGAAAGPAHAANHPVQAVQQHAQQAHQWAQQQVDIEEELFFGEFPSDDDDGLGPMGEWPHPQAHAHAAVAPVQQAQLHHHHHQVQQQHQQLEQHQQLAEAEELDQFLEEGWVHQAMPMPLVQPLVHAPQHAPQHVPQQQHPAVAGNIGHMMAHVAAQQAPQEPPQHPHAGNLGHLAHVAAAAANAENVAAAAANNADDDDGGDDEPGLQMVVVAPHHAAAAAHAAAQQPQQPQQHLLQQQMQQQHMQHQLQQAQQQLLHAHHQAHAAPAAQAGAAAADDDDVVGEAYGDSGCPALARVRLASDAMRSLTWCPALARVRLASDAMRSLTWCPTVARVRLASDVMKSLMWSHFPNLETLSLECRSLTSLRLHDCDRLSAAAVSGLGERGLGRPSSVPELQELTVESCSDMNAVSLSHPRLTRLLLSQCDSVRTLSLAAPSLSHLALDECGSLAHASLVDVCVPKLSFGACPALQSLSLAGADVATLDLRGCAALEALAWEPREGVENVLDILTELDCPALACLDATFCGQLGARGLASALSGRVPPLEQLLLSVCQLVDTSALVALSSLSLLKTLDLSYTDVCELRPLYAACPQLQSLNVASCRSLDAGSLMQVVPAYGGALPCLRTLDASYVRLSTAQACDLITLGPPLLEELFLNGVEGITDEALLPTPGHTSVDGVHTAPPTLRTLSLVKCGRLRCVALGLAPAPGVTVTLFSAKQRLFVSEEEDAAGAAPLSWVPAVTHAHVAGLKILRLGLSGVQVLALALPSLQQLDVSGCAQLRHLELRCPALLQLAAASCRALRPPPLWASLRGCPALRSLDAQHAPALGRSLSAAAVAAGLPPPAVKRGGGASAVTLRNDELLLRGLPPHGPSVVVASSVPDHPGDAEEDADLAAKAALVVRVAAYRACNVLLPGACAAVPGVLDAVVRLQLVDSARFLFLAHGEDFVEAALCLMAALDAADAPPAAEVERERLAHVVAWEPTEAALTATEYGPRPGDAVSAAMAMQLAIFGSLTALAAATSEELADNAAPPAARAPPNAACLWKPLIVSRQMGSLLQTIFF